MPEVAFPTQAGSDYTAKIHSDTYPEITAAKCNQRGRAVFVTGASKGIGRAIAIAYAQAGASHIAIGSRSCQESVEKDIIEQAKIAGHPTPQVLNLVLDVSSDASVAAAVSRTEQAFGRLDFLINNAGRLEKWYKLAETDPASWWTTWETNVKGTYLLTRGFLPLLLKGGEKTIININSVGAHLTRPGASAYQSGKLAICRLTEFTSVEYAEEGVIAMAINPGAVATELTTTSLPPLYHSNLVDKPELSADTIVWLTEERKPWLSGRYLSANWNMPEIMARKEEIINGNKLKVRLVL